VAVTREYAPAAIQHVFDRLCQLRPRVPWELSGIVGDASHVKGYHRARAVLPPDDYSVELKRDRGGPAWAACALDIKPPDLVHHQRLTRRLRGAVTLRDRRLSPVREFYGSLDGESVYGWDLATGQRATSDLSHLWHIHLSFYRETVGRPALLAPVADVLAEALSS
jgi:hypothetical protein